MITANRSIKNEAGNVFKFEVKCDLSKLTEDQVKEYAFDAIWIKEQSRMRAMSNSALEAYNGTYKFVAESKGTRSAPVISTAKIVEVAREKMSKDERLALIKQLESM